MAGLRPRVAFLLLAILVCFILVKQVQAQSKCDQSLSPESCSEEANPKTEVLGASNPDDDDDDDDARDGNVKLEDDDDADDDRPDVVVMGH